MKEEKGINKFSATSSIVGYLYQIRYGLLDALRRTRGGNDFICQLELLDDVHFESGSEIELIQTKHHISRAAKLTDTSVDVWKSLRIWSEYIKSDKYTEGTVFYLVTTAVASEGSAFSYLRSTGEAFSPKKSLERLISIANSSISTANQLSYQAFKRLSQKQREVLIESIVLLDGQPNIENIDDELKKEAFWASEKKHLDSFMQRLEGWWIKRVVRLFTHKNNNPILSQEIYAEMTSLREQFKSDNLPIDNDILEIGGRRIIMAIKNYLRAATQRSRWIREDLLMIGELDRYEMSLRDEWELRFEQMKDDLGEDVADLARNEAAKELYKFFETGELPPIRPSCTEPFIARGTYQILADKLIVGWHPDFIKRLSSIISS